jgi:hypothetical protein
MQTNETLIASLFELMKRLPNDSFSSNVIEFIDLMKSAKYSTFLTPEREQQYFDLNIAATLAQMQTFDAACKGSVLLVPSIRKYFSTLKTQAPVEDDFF